MNTIERLAHLIAFDTTSRLSNLALIDDTANYLHGMGAKPWLAYNEQGTKANLFATIPAANGSVEGGLILSGHTDVVPTDSAFRPKNTASWPASKTSRGRSSGSFTRKRSPKANKNSCFA
jgi:acetylornithine deacetylase/succinyl-diaminopimelate desuccinylase-like protein